MSKEKEETGIARLREIVRYLADVSYVKDYYQIRKVVDEALAILAELEQ